MGTEEDSGHRRLLNPCDVLEVPVELQSVVSRFACMNSSRVSW